MKKIILLLVILGFMNCQGKYKAHRVFLEVAEYSFTEDGMKFKVIWDDASQRGGLHVINLTLDKLQCEYYELKVKELKAK